MEKDTPEEQSPQTPKPGNDELLKDPAIARQRSFLRKFLLDHEYTTPEQLDIYMNSIPDELISYSVPPTVKSEPQKTSNPPPPPTASPPPAEEQRHEDQPEEQLQEDQHEEQPHEYQPEEQPQEDQHELCAEANAEKIRPSFFKRERNCSHCNHCQSCVGYWGSIFTDFIIWYHWSHFLLLNLAFVVMASGVQLILTGLAQAVGNIWYFSSDLNSWDIWYKIGIGAFGIVAGVILAAGTKSDRVKCQFSYLGIALMYLASIVCGVILLSLFNTEENIRQKLQHTLDQFHGESQGIFQMQSELICCGISNYTDYQKYGIPIPTSCCYSQSNYLGNGSKLYELCTTNLTTGLLIDKGCQRAFMMYHRPLYIQHQLHLIFALVVTLMTIFTMLWFIPLSRRRNKLFEDRYIDEFDDPRRLALTITDMIEVISTKLHENESKANKEAIAELDRLKFLVL